MTIFCKFVTEIEIQVLNFNSVPKKSSITQERHFRTKLKLSTDCTDVIFEPNWSKFVDFLQDGLIISPLETKLDKFKRLLDPSIRTEYDPYVDKNTIDDKDNENFKQLSKIYLEDTKFKFFEEKLISIIKKDWSNGEKEKEQADKYIKIQFINKEYQH